MRGRECTSSSRCCSCRGGFKQCVSIHAEGGPQSKASTGSRVKWSTSVRPTEGTYSGRPPNAPLLLPVLPNEPKNFSTFNFQLSASTHCTVV